MTKLLHVCIKPSQDGKVWTKLQSVKNVDRGWRSFFCHHCNFTILVKR